MTNSNQTSSKGQNDSQDKHCMFQCALRKNTIFGYVNEHNMVEDTGLITWNDAVALWDKWKPEVIKQLEDNQDPEMCIWTGCENETSYHTDAFHVNRDTEIDNGDFIEIVKKVIDPSKVIMGTPLKEVKL